MRTPAPRTARVGRSSVVAPALALLLALAVAPPSPAQVSENVIFRANLDEHSAYNDIWGYTAPNGDEYALLGATTGLAVINVTDPSSPYETGFLSGATSTWRDIKTYQHWAYVTNETSGGLMIVDLADPESPVLRPAYGGFSSAHNLYIDESTGLCYIAGSNLGAGGLRILDLSFPESPIEIGSWETAYLHDIMVQNGRGYGSAIYQDRLYVLDVTNPASIGILGTAEGYPNAFTHNAWVTADDHYVMTTDETTGAACRLWDVSNPAAMTQTDFYLPNPSTIPHNTHIEGNYAYISHYTLGLRIVDISDPFDIVEAGYYDTWPASDGGTYDGLWGAFPFFGTNPDLVVGSDISTGLWVWEFQGPLGTLAGTVTDADAPGTPVELATVELLGTGTQVVTDSTGAYSIQSTAGGATLRVSAFGFETQDVPATVTQGVVTTVDVALDRAPGGSLGGTVTAGGAPLAGATVTLVGTTATATSDGSGAWALPVVPAGTWTVRAEAFGWNVAQEAVTLAAGGSGTVDLDLTAAFVADDFETAVFGWLVSGNATTGDWERADPQPTEGGTVQPGDDHTPDPGVNAWITGPLAGSSAGSYDVDGGETVLTSPTFNLGGLDDPHVRYWRWYSTGVGGGNTSTDVFTVEVTSDGGGSWTVLESTEESPGAWVMVDFALADHVSITSLTKFRFTARDTAAGSITEAGLDDFTIYEIVDQSSTGIAGAPGFAPQGLSLGAAYPNPCAPGEALALHFVLPRAGRIVASVHDVAGRRVAVLADGIRERGPGELRWDGRTVEGRAAPAGVYFVKLDTEDGTRTRKALLLR